LAEEEDVKLKAGSGDPPSVRMGEIGTIGLATIDKSVREQVKKELQWPQVAKTYKTMMNDPMIYAGVSLIEMMIAKVNWHVKEPENATTVQKQRTEFIRQCMHDMEHSWEDFIKEILSYLTYGFSVHEKVFRRRTLSKGSKYEDNLIGWKKLGIRSQDTLAQWKWSKDGRTLTHVYQDLNRVNSSSSDRFNFYFNSADKDPEGLKIPRNKFLLFRYNAKRDNPIGNSPLNACYVPYKIRTVIEEREAIGVQRNLEGMPVLGLHPKYMSPDATPEDAAVYDYYKNIMRNIQNNEQGTIIYPLMYNDAGKKIVEFELMSSKGGQSQDTDKIIKRYDDKILTALFADILKLGQDSHGSFSLAGAKTNIVAVNIESRLKEIAGVINQDLVKQTYEMNGWTDTVRATVVYEDLDEEDLDIFSKLVQRVGSVGYLPRDKQTVSEVAKRAGFTNPDRFLDMSDAEFEKLFPEATSRSGDGLKTAGEGTSTEAGGDDKSTSNTENS
jgi:hypothetical protein